MGGIYFKYLFLLFQIQTPFFNTPIYLCAFFLSEHYYLCETDILKMLFAADRIRSHDLTHWVKSNSALNHSATTTTYTTSELHCTYTVNVE